ncbi:MULTISPECIES: carbohydrate ABC transporter permease [Bacillaceae]|uniref:Carbohydrate ABC transporter permease n=1 Tax=Bacillus infantis TaxID=324767 RepID=A0A5D4SKT0_9BACI|nr:MULTISPECIES: carbohydrate ABC transporter permease [Bacillus]MDW2876542.1 carbohydrate ABC transporter permease [Bacillus infantis]PLR73633.1 carbohydrate ABC transporter permease [Bacillus sp. UMB0728]RYI27864.1 carbohydrate ABC transporter permease [Bacillus infantis]TYS63843.1 carbohydrate ABC transporter permease [Bacillus infantis]
MRKISLSMGIIYTVLIIISLLVLVPILNLLAMSLSDPLKVHELKGLDILPKGFSLINYQVLFSNPLIVKSIFNSLLITICGTALNLFLTAMAAYVLARTNFAGKKLVILFLIVVMVFEPGLIPEYLLVKDLGLLDSYLSLILYKAINVFYLFIMMRFFEDVPDSILEAARIDGAGHFKIFTKIMLPLSKPALATMGLFYGVYHWNEYFRATIYLTTPDKWPLQVVLRQFVVERDNTSLLGAQNVLSYEQIAALDFGSLQAGTIIISIVPLLIFYPLILKYYAKGALEGGVKD